MQMTDKQEQKIIKILRTLPYDKADELLDFAEYLKTKSRATRQLNSDTQMDLPTYHLGRIAKNAIDRDTLYGEYLDRKFD